MYMCPLPTAYCLLPTAYCPWPLLCHVMLSWGMWVWGQDPADVERMNFLSRCKVKNGQPSTEEWQIWTPSVESCWNTQ